jgi:hypothetical protein
MCPTFGENETPVVLQTIKDRIFTLAHDLRDLETEYLQKEEELTNIKLKIEAIQGGHRTDGSLPSALKEAGVDGLLLPDGSTIEIKIALEVPSMAATSEYRPKVISYLEANGQGGVVKSEFKVLLGKGTEKKVKALQRFADRLGLASDTYATVHPATLKKTIGELLENNTPVPMDELNIREYSYAEFEEPKKSKKKH